MSGDRNPGDVMVSRANGTADIYLIGIITVGPYGLTLETTGLKMIKGRDSALRAGNEQKTGANTVWLCDGREATDTDYVVAPRPSN